MPVPGVTVTVVDEPTVAGAPTDTSTAFLLTTDANAPATPTRLESLDDITSVLATATTARVHAEAIMRESQTATGAADVIVLKYSTLSTALAALPASLGPGQIVAPEAIVAADHAAIAQHAWENNRFALLNGPSAATDSQLLTLAAATSAAGYGRAAALYADLAIVPTPGGATAQIPWSVVQAGIIARNDLATDNPGLAAAGDNGIVQHAVGIAAERTDAAMATLRTGTTGGGRVNVARAPYNGAPRSFGYRTLEDSGNRAHWWDISGARVVMDVRANAAAATDRVVFGQVDGGGRLLATWNGLLATRCLELLRVGALFEANDGGERVEPFRVDTGPALNPRSSLAAGVLKAEIRLRTSPFAEDVRLTVVRQSIT